MMIIKGNFDPPVYLTDILGNAVMRKKVRKPLLKLWKSDHAEACKVAGNVVGKLLGWVLLKPCLVNETISINHMWIWDPNNSLRANPKKSVVFFGRIRPYKRTDGTIDFTCFIRKQRPFRGGFMLLSSERFSTTYDDCYC